MFFAALHGSDDKHLPRPPHTVLHITNEYSPLLIATGASALNGAFCQGGLIERHCCHVYPRWNHGNKENGGNILRLLRVNDMQH